MGMIMSPVRAIDDLYFYPLPTGRIFKVTRAIRVDRVTVFIGEDGKLYGDPLSKPYAYMCGNYFWTSPLMKALVKLGVITQAQADEHEARCAQNDKRRSALDALKYVPAQLAGHGVTLSAEQMAILEAAAGKEPVS